MLSHSTFPLRYLRSGRRLGTAGAVAAVLAGIVGVMLLHTYADTQRQGETLLARIEALTDQLMLAHEHAMQVPNLQTSKAEVEVPDEADRIEADLVQTLGELERLDPRSGRAGNVRVAVHSYQGTSHVLAELAQAGDLSAEEQWHASVVEPSSARLVAVVSDAAQYYDRQAELANRLSEAGTLLILALVAGLTVALLRREQLAERTALSRSEARFRSLVQGAPDVITVLGADGTILMETPAIERVLGYSPASRIGTASFGFVHPDDVAAARAEFARILAEPGATSTIVLRVRHADGTWRWIDGRARNELQNPDVAGIVINYRDITDEKSSQAELLQRANHDSLTGFRIDFLCSSNWTTPSTSSRPSRAPWRCCCWTWTASKRSTTRSATKPATRCCARSVRA